MISNLASFWENTPPELDSLMPPVKGDLPPTEIRPVLAAMVPVKRPVAMTSLLSLLSG
jgi:hypothetical protein